MHKYINLDNLPKHKNNIDWINSIGKTCYFEYDNIKGIIEIVDYDINNKKVNIKYKDKTYKIATTSLPRVTFGKLLGKYSSDFKININKNIVDEYRDIVIIDREYRKNSKGQRRKWYKFKCNKCGWEEGWIEESHLISGRGCSCCYGKTVVKGINDIATTNPKLVKYFTIICYI